MKWKDLPKERKRALLIRRTVVCVCFAAVLALMGTGLAAAVGAIARSVSSSAESVLSQADPAFSAPSASVPAAAAASSIEPVQSTGTESSAASADAESWFDDAVFIGDSRTMGLENVGGLGDATFYAVEGLMVSTAYTKADIRLNGNLVTVMQAMQNSRFDKVYIMLGVNELGWSSPTAFEDGYRKMITDIKACQPGAAIYLQAILPVTAAKSAEGVYTNDKIAAYNRQIQQIAGEEQAVYLPVDTAVANQDGMLPDDAASDGVHLNAKYCGIWRDYLVGHTQP